MVIVLVMYSDKVKFKRILFSPHNHITMQKLIIPLIACFMFCATVASAQMFKIGPKVGIGATVKNLEAATADGSDNLNDKFKQANVSTQVGAFLRLKVLGFFVQPELMVTSLKDLDIPFMFGTKLGPVRAMAGPYIRMAFDREALTDAEERETMLQSAKYGYQAGLGLDLGKRIVIDLRYEGNFTGSSANVLGADRPFDSGDPQVILTLGYSLTGGGKK